jgi:hypothetical protein
MGSIRKSEKSLSADSQHEFAFRRFLGAADPGGGDPDFHRPEKFLPPRFVDGGLPAARGEG